MINIGMIEPVGSHGGNDIYCHNLSKSISRNSHINLILYGPDEFHSNDLFTSKAFFKNVYNSKSIILKFTKYFIGMLKSLIDAKKNNIDIIHLHFFGFSILDYLNIYLCKYFFGFKVVGTIHDIESFATFENKKNFVNLNWWRSIDLSYFLKNLNGIIVHSDFAKSLIIQNCLKKKIDPPKIFRIYASDVDYDSLDFNFDISKSREKIRIPADKIVILFFGQIKKVKNLSLLIKSMKSVARKRNNVLLLVAGKIWKDDISLYKSLIDKYSLGDFVEIRNKFISNDLLPHYFNSADIVSLPYKKIYNSGVLIRAMSFSKAIVASDIPVFKEFITNSEDGVLFRNNDSVSLSNQLLNLISLKDDSRFEMGKLAKESLMKKIDIDIISNQYYNFYKFIN